MRKQEKVGQKGLLIEDTVLKDKKESYSFFPPFASIAYFFDPLPDFIGLI